jgi:hypothetical protein
MWAVRLVYFYCCVDSQILPNTTFRTCGRIEISSEAVYKEKLEEDPVLKTCTRNVLPTAACDRLANTITGRPVDLRSSALPVTLNWLHHRLMHLRVSSGAVWAHMATSKLQAGCIPGYKRASYRNNANIKYSHALIPWNTFLLFWIWTGCPQIHQIMLKIQCSYI